jgi:hypothetical protein
MASKNQKKRLNQRIATKLMIRYVQLMNIYKQDKFLNFKIVKLPLTFNHSTTQFG